MWRKIGLIIGGIVILKITWFCSITIPLIIVARFFETTKLTSHIIVLFMVVPLLLVCWLVGLWIGKKIGEKGWLYGGLPALVFTATTFLRPRVWKTGYLQGESLMSFVTSFFILLLPLVLLGIAGGIRGEKVAKRRKARI